MIGIVKEEEEEDVGAKVIIKDEIEVATVLGGLKDGAMRYAFVGVVDTTPYYYTLFPFPQPTCNRQWAGIAWEDIGYCWLAGGG